MADSPNPDAWRGTIRRRLAVVVALFLTWATGIEGRLAYLQLYRHDDYVAKADRQYKRTLPLPAIRGDIVDRNNRVLATSADVETIYAVPTDIDDAAQTAKALCSALEDCTPDFRATLTERLGKSRPFQYVKRHVTPHEAEAVRALKLDGIGFMTESHRFYPNRDLLGPTLGYVGFDNKGLGGLEQQYDTTIRGSDGRVVVVTDARKHAFDRIERPPSAGASIELTIDSVLQHEVERELAEGIRANRAQGGVAIVMDPWSGEILAMASEPDFNPNIASRVEEKLRHNRAIEEIYEPGSTFKTVTASAALDENILTPDTLIDCAPGYIDIGPRRVRDVHPNGTISFTDVIVKSSNVGAIRTGFKVGAERLERYVRRFGFGTKLLPDLPAEASGIVWTTMTDSALASVSMGYQVGVTPLQMATAVSSIANGGVLMRPHLVRAIVRDGVRQVVAPLALRRTVSADTAATLTGIMEGVVVRGTGKAARMDGYLVAAKSGTAAKLVDHVYSKSEYMASFVGFLPSRKPQMTILVVIDTPRAGPYFGGLVAAPIFKRIADIAVREFGVPRTVNPETPVVVTPAVTGQTMPVLWEPLRQERAAQGPDGLMPDLRGLSARQAVRTLGRLGVTPRLTGSGFVTDQRPEAGTALDAGGTVDLRLARELPAAEGDTARP